MRTTETTAKSNAEQSALVTELRGICGWDFINDDSFTLCLVGDERLQLEIAPVAYPIIHHSSTMLLADSFQVFHHYTTTIEGSDYPLAHVMVYPSHVTVFSTTQSSQEEFACSSAFDLKNMTQIFVLSLHAFDCALIIKPAVTCDGEVVYSEVDAQNTLRSVVSSIDLSREREYEECAVLRVHAQQTLTDVPAFEVFSVTSGNIECDFHDALHALEFERVSLQAGTSGEVVSNTRPGNNGLALGLLDDCAGLFDATHCKLARQRFSDVFVDERVELDVILDAPLPGLIDAILLHPHERLDSPDCLVRGWNLDFSSHNTSHTGLRSTTVYKYCEEVAFLHRNKIAVSPCDTTL